MSIRDGLAWDQIKRRVTAIKRAALILCSDRNAEEIFDPGFLEMSYQNAMLSKLGCEMCATAARMAREP